jgi:undecaprenyl-diphosphatase
VDLRKRHPPSLSPRALAIAGWSAFLIAGSIFLVIGWQVSARMPLVALDAKVATWLHEHASNGLTAFLLAVTHLHSTGAIAAWSVLFAVVLARLREWYWILTLAFAVCGGMLINLVLKAAYERVRPQFEDPLLILTTYSFPSGHTAAAVVFYGVLAAFLVSRFYDWRRRAACITGAIVAVALVAFSRMYLGAHYLTDVVAATCSSTAWLVLCLAGGHALVRGKLGLRWMLVAVLALAALAGLLLPTEDWSDALEDAVEQMNPLAGFAIFCIVYIAATLVLLPPWILPLVAGAAFGLGWGTIAALISSTVAAVAAFLLARYVVRKRVENAARKHPAFKALDQAVAKDPWRMVALLRLSPVMPSGIKSYFLGLTRVPLAAYSAASAAGMFPGLALKVYVGATGRGALQHGGALNWMMFAAGVAATVALTIVVGRVVQRRVKLQGQGAARFFLGL